MPDGMKPDARFAEDLWALVEFEAFGPQRVDSTSVIAPRRRGALLAAAAAVIVLMMVAISSLQTDRRALERLDVADPRPTPSAQPDPEQPAPDPPGPAPYVEVPALVVPGAPPLPAPLVPAGRPQPVRSLAAAGATGQSADIATRVPVQAAARVPQLLFDEREPGQAVSRPALWNVGPSTSRSTPLRLGTGSHRRAVFSPDGRQIVFQSAGRNGHKGWQIYRADADGSNQRRLTYATDCEQNEAAPHCLDTAPAWSPTGDAIAFSRGGAQPCEGVAFECTTIFLVNPDGGRPRAVARGWGASWSPDGQSLVYSAVPDSGETAACDRTLTKTCNGTLHVVRRDGTQMRSLGVRGSNPRWSPDGTWIAFEGEHLDQAPHQVRLVRPDGSGLRDVLPPGHDQPAWTPDGQLLTAVADAGQRDIWLSRMDGSGMRRITNTPADESFPLMRPFAR